MTQIRISENSLIVDIEGLDKFWALKSRMRFALAHVRGATADPGIVKEPRGLRAPGTYLPGVIIAGTYRQEGRRTFWLVRDSTKAVVIELAGQAYDRLVLELEDPRGAVDLIERAVAAHQAR